MVTGRFITFENREWMGGIIYEICIFFSKDERTDSYGR